MNQEREFEAVRKDGTHFPFLLRVTEMRDGEARLFNGVVQDISSRKHTEENRERLFEVIRETVNHLSSSSEQISAIMAEQSRGSEGQALASRKRSPPWKR
ncbi:MAG: PAS domain S-box protein [Planctomycetota bacterium]